MKYNPFLYNVIEKLVALVLMLGIVALVLLGLSIIVLSGVFLFASPTLFDKFIWLLALIVSIITAMFIFQIVSRLLDD
jgi:hypothetical protein